jgi:hypothetical protein
MMVQEGQKHVGVKYTLWHFMFLINSAFVGKIILYVGTYFSERKLFIFQIDVKFMKGPVQ